MKVVFLQDVLNVGKAGETKEVADGYARNYLLPKKLVVINSPGAASRVKAGIEASKETALMNKLAGEIEGKEITLKVKMGARERMHGSVTSANIAAELETIIGQPIDKRKVDLVEPIKQLGSYDIPVKLAKGIEPKIKVNIIEKEKEVKEETAKEDGGKGE
jgi:large subunit ribosomal protein L9